MDKDSNCSMRCSIVMGLTEMTIGPVALLLVVATSLPKVEC